MLAKQLMLLEKQLILFTPITNITTFLSNKLNSKYCVLNEYLLVNKLTHFYIYLLSMYEFNKHLRGYLFLLVISNNMWMFGNKSKASLA